MDITRGYRIVRRYLGPVLLLVTITFLWEQVDAARLPPPQRVATRAPITSRPAVPAAALLRDRNVAPSDICGWQAGQHGGDPRAPLQCSSTQSFCALIRPDIIGCCDPDARRSGTPACEYFTACFASTDVDEAIAKNTRVQRCTYTAPWTITAETSTFDAFESLFVTFDTTWITTSTESECVTWAFEMDGTTGPSTYGCATSGTSIVIKTALPADHLTAQITALYSLDTNRGGSTQTGGAGIDWPVPTTASLSRGTNTSPGSPISSSSSSRGSNTSPGLPISSSPTTSPAASDPALSTGAIVGIVAGLALAVLAVFYVVKYWKKKRSQHHHHPSPTVGPTSNAGNCNTATDTGNESSTSGTIGQPQQTITVQVPFPSLNTTPIPTPPPPPPAQESPVHSPVYQYHTPPAAATTAPNVTPTRDHHHTRQDSDGQASNHMSILSANPPPPGVSSSLQRWEVHR